MSTPLYARYPFGPPIAHVGHRRATLVGRGPDGLMIGAVICNCGSVIEWLPRCPELTRKGQPCRSLARIDLGFATCWSHGEGRGATSTPRRRRIA